MVAAIVPSQIIDVPVLDDPHEPFERAGSVPRWHASPHAWGEGMVDHKVADVVEGGWFG